MKNGYKIILIFLLAWMPDDGDAQSVLRQSDYEERVEKYRYPDEKPEPATVNFTQNEEINAVDWSYILKGALYTILTIGLFISLYFILRKYLKDDRNKELREMEIATSIEQAEQNLPILDLGQLLEEALKNDDYRAALRIRYLELLQFLDRQKRIKWETYKTNGQYVDEYTRSEKDTSFRDLTRVFDRIWYGQMPIDQSGFQQWQEIVLNIRNLSNE